MNAELRPGETLYSVAAVTISPFRRRSREDVRFVIGLDGFRVTRVVQDGRTLWMFVTLNDAKRARNAMEAKGIKTDRNICRFVVADDGMPEFEGVAE